MSDIYEENGFLMADFSKPTNPPDIEERLRKAVFGGVDLASGYPTTKIWTTKDGRNIPVHQLSDSHLCSIITFLRRSSEVYKKKMAVNGIFKLAGMALLVENKPRVLGVSEPDDTSFSQFYDSITEELRAIWDMRPDDFLHEFVPIFRELYSEAYSRKLALFDYQGEV